MTARKKKIPPLLSLALSILLKANGWTAKEVAAVSGVHRSTISKYENGDLEVSRELLVELAAKMGLGAERVDEAIEAAREIHRGPSAPATPVDPSPPQLRVISRAAHQWGRNQAALFKGILVGEVQDQNVREEKEKADALWKELKTLSKEGRRRAVEENPACWTWGLCLLFCDESERAAARDATKALELADLARLMARTVTDLEEYPEAWCSCLRAYAEAFFANALKVSNKLPPAAAAFARARSLWRDGADPAKLLSEARLLDLGASVCWAQRRFDEALKLHEEALRVARPGEDAFILLNKSATLEQMGDYEGSLAALAQAEPRLDRERQPRLRCVLQYNRAMCLCRLGRAEEARPLVDEVWRLAEALRNDLDLLKVRWLAAVVAAGLGQIAPAVESLEEVCREAYSRELFYSYALAGLDLALLYREQGRWAEIRGLAAQWVKIFEAQEVHRETLAALLLFQEAAEQETVTEALVRRLQEYLKQAQSLPGQRFKL